MIDTLLVAVTIPVAGVLVLGIVSVLGAVAVEIVERLQDWQTK